MTENDEEHPATECIVINQDGNQFCALMGPNLQEGHAGFGDTPLHAILDLISFQADNSGLKEILNQKPDQNIGYI